MTKILTCTACALCENQRPLLQKRIAPSWAMFVGLSAVRVDDVEISEPLGASTPSGALMREIAHKLGEGAAYFTNLVKCLPLDGEKMRYPTEAEMEACRENLCIELAAVRPARIVLLGRMVSEYVGRTFGVTFVFTDEFSFKTGVLGRARVMAAHHPSYALRYRRRELMQYVTAIQGFVTAPGNSDLTRQWRGRLAPAPAAHSPNIKHTRLAEGLK